MKWLSFPSQSTAKTAAKRRINVNVTNTWLFNNLVLKTIFFCTAIYSTSGDAITFLEVHLSEWTFHSLITEHFPGKILLLHSNFFHLMRQYNQVFYVNNTMCIRVNLRAGFRYAGDIFKPTADTNLEENENRIADLYILNTFSYLLKILNKIFWCFCFFTFPSPPPQTTPTYTCIFELHLDRCFCG